LPRRVRFSGEKLILQCPSLGHEFMATLFGRLIQDSTKFPSLSGVNRTVLFGGSADIDLDDGGIKSPDYSLYENHRDLKELPLMHALPTVVWEVAYSESENDLARDLARHVACSVGGVRLAIGLKISHTLSTGDQLKALKSVTCEYWEVDGVEEFATLEESGSCLDTLSRCDEYTDADEEIYNLPPGKRYSCVSMVDEKFVKFIVSLQNRYIVSDIITPMSPPIFWL
jgi:hypothetical protein